MGYVPLKLQPVSRTLFLREAAALIYKPDCCSCCGGKLVATGTSKWKSCSKCNQWFERT